MRSLAFAQPFGEGFRPPFLRSGGPSNLPLAWADYRSGSLTVHKRNGGTVAGTYTRADANGTGYYLDGSGYAVAMTSNSPYFHTSQGLIMEVGSANLCLRAVDQQNAYWTKSNTTVITSPDTTTPANVGNTDRLVENNDVSQVHSVQRGAISKSSGARMTQSIFVRPGSRTKVQLRLNHNGVSANRMDSIFTLTGAGTVNSSTASGTWSGASARIESVGNGWYRIEQTCLTSTDTSVLFSVYMVNAAGSATYNGDGSSYLDIWGFQLEEHSIATSLMASVASSATRANPSLTYPVTSYDIVPPVGPMAFECNLWERRLTLTAGAGLDGRVYQVTGETSRYLRKISGGLTFGAYYGGAEAVGTVSTETLVKLHHRVRTAATAANKLFQNLTEIGTQATVANPTGTATALRIGSSAADTNIFNGRIANWAFYDREIGL